MTRPDLQEVWMRIEALEGQEFQTKTGRPFTYEISGNVFRRSRAGHNISKSDFGRALELVPFDGPGVVNELIRGPAYVWAVLHDRRVRQEDW